MSRLTHSQMTCYKTCPRKCCIAYEYSIRPDYSDRPLRFGANFHIGLDSLGKGQAIADAVVAAVAAYEVLPCWATTDEAMHEWAIERITVAKLLEGYSWYWSEVDAGIEVIESEKVFEVPIVNPDTGKPTPKFTLAGKRDKLIKLPDGRVLLREHKTTSEDLEPESDYWRRWRIDQQISAYYIACRAEGIRIDSVEVDAIRKPLIRPASIPVVDADGFKIVNDADGKRCYLDNGKPRQSGDTKLGWKLQSRIETPEEFGTRLEADIRSRPEWYYARREIPRLETDLVEFREELWQIQQQYAQSQQKGRWFRNTAACRSFGKACAYFDICTNGIPVGVTGSLPQGFVRVEDVHPELMSEEG